MYTKLNHRYTFLHERFLDCSCETEALLWFKVKAVLQKSYLTCYIKNYNFFNSWLTSLNENTDQQKLQECYFKNLEVKCFLAFTGFPTNSLFFRMCKATCKIGLLTFHEPLIFSPRLAVFLLCATQFIKMDSLDPLLCHYFVMT